MFLHCTHIYTLSVDVVLLRNLHFDRDVLHVYMYHCKFTRVRVSDVIYTYAYILVQEIQFGCVHNTTSGRSKWDADGTRTEPGSSVCRRLIPRYVPYGASVTTIMRVIKLVFP